MEKDEGSQNLLRKNKGSQNIGLRAGIPIQNDRPLKEKVVTRIKSFAFLYVDLHAHLR